VRWRFNGADVKKHPLFLSSFLFPVCLLAASLAEASLDVFPINRQPSFQDNTSAFARPAAMGSAFVAVADDASALFFNPSGLAGLGQGQVSANTHFWLADTFEETLLFAMPGPDGWGGFCVAGGYQGFGTLEGRDELGSSAPDYSASRLLFKTGWGRDFLDNFSAGIALQGVQSQIAESNQWDFTLDAGVLLKLTHSLKLGAACNNMAFNASRGLPASELLLGASDEWELGSSGRLLASVSAGRITGIVDDLSAGVEWGFEKQLFLRAGYRMPVEDNGITGLTGLTAGMGFVLSEVHLDYAYLPYGELGTSHRVSLSYRFGDFPKKNAAVSRDAEGRLTGSGAGGEASRTPKKNQGRAAVTPASEDRTPLSTEKPAMNPSAETIVLPGPVGGSAVTLLKPPAADASAGKNPLNLEFEIPSEITAQGQALEKKGMYREAVMIYQKAIRDDPRDITAWIAMGNVYYRLNQKQTAVYCYEQALKAEPDNRKLADWLQKYKAGQP
jgi:hypothetical protein